MLFGRERESKAPSESGSATATPTPRNRAREPPFKLSLFSAFRTSRNVNNATTNSATSGSAKGSSLGSTPPSLHCGADRAGGGAKLVTTIKTHAGRESETGEVLLEWEAPSPARKWQSRTPPPLSKLKKSFSSLFNASYSSSSSTPSSPKSPSPFSLFKSPILSTRVRVLSFCVVCLQFLPFHVFSLRTPSKMRRMRSSEKTNSAMCGCDIGRVGVRNVEKT